MRDREPANDPRPWSPTDDFFACPCGSPHFVIKRDAARGWFLILCRTCDADHSMLLAGDVRA